jgi:alcohol dehydrogenase class IV
VRGEKARTGDTSSNVARSCLVEWWGQSSADIVMDTRTEPAAFTFPNRILFGEGSRRGIGSELARLGISRPLVVTDAGLTALGIVDEVAGHIRSKALHATVSANPTEADCLAALDTYRSRGCDGLVGLGGGSPIDTAKAVRLLVTHPGCLADYDVTSGGMHRITSNLPPMVAVPTTAGTGSEAGRGALIQLPKTGRKTAIVSPHLLPTLAVCDPELTRSLSPSLTAGTGFDAFSHAVESYLSKTFHPICDGIALESLRHLSHGLEASVRDGANATARRSMMIAALLAGISFHKGLGAVHALSHALGSRGRAHHGTLNAILMPYVLRFNREASEVRLNDLAVHMGLGRSADGAGHLITLTELLLKRLPLANRLGDIDGLERGQIPHYAALALKDHCLATNPREASQADLEEILSRAW